MKRLKTEIIKKENKVASFKVASTLLMVSVLIVVILFTLFTLFTLVGLCLLSSYSPYPLYISFQSFALLILVYVLGVLLAVGLAVLRISRYKKGIKGIKGIKGGRQESKGNSNKKTNKRTNKKSLSYPFLEAPGEKPIKTAKQNSCKDLPKDLREGGPIPFGGLETTYQFCEPINGVINDLLPTQINYRQTLGVPEIIALHHSDLHGIS